MYCALIVALSPNKKCTSK